MPRRRATEGGGAVEPAAPKLARGTRRKLLPVVADARPHTRAECRPGGWNVARPCPFVGCAAHLYLNVDRTTGDVTINRPDREPWELAESCQLDVAERNGRERADGYMVGDGATLDEVGDAFDLTREGVRRIEQRALLKLRLASPSPDQLGAYVVPDELAADLARDFPAGPDEDERQRARIERALRGNPEENNKTIATLVGASQARVAEVRAELGIAPVSGWGQKS